MSSREGLYGEMSELTRPLCGTECGWNTKNRCCSYLYCLEAKSWAKTHYQIDLPETDHPDLLFMGPEGCTVPPHLRPVCTIHVCCISSLGFKVGDSEWTEKYFKLRDQIDELEWEEGNK